jgi:hypothetical protein
MNVQVVYTATTKISSVFIRSADLENTKQEFCPLCPNVDPKYAEFRVK